MLHKRSIKLASLYLGIIMIVSLLFSFSVYELSTNEIERGLRRPIPAVGRLNQDTLRIFKQQLTEDRILAVSDARQKVLGRLLVINIGVLVVGGYLSYLLAHRTLKPMEDANRAMERFTADASHELRTPITVMKSEIEVALLDKKLGIKEAKNILASNVEELDKMTGLAEHLLRLSSLKAQNLNMNSVGLTHLFNTAQSRVKGLALKKNITINTKSNKFAVIADEHLLVEMLVIFLDNAIKYSPESTVVTMGAERSGQKVRLLIKDQGVGIKNAELPHIFDRFYRADSSRTKQQAPGYGLGLAIAKSIIDLHEGDVQVSSSPGEGTEFRVSLPVK